MTQSARFTAIRGGCVLCVLCVLCVSVIVATRNAGPFFHASVIQIPARTWEEAPSRLSGSRVASWTAGPPRGRVCSLVARPSFAPHPRTSAHAGVRQHHSLTGCLLCSFLLLWVGTFSSEIGLFFFSLLFIIKVVIFILPLSIFHLTFKCCSPCTLVGRGGG